MIKFRQPEFDFGGPKKKAENTNAPKPSASRLSGNAPLSEGMRGQNGNGKVGPNAQFMAELAEYRRLSKACEKLIDGPDSLEERMGRVRENDKEAIRTLIDKRKSVHIPDWSTFYEDIEQKLSMNSSQLSQREFAILKLIYSLAYQHGDADRRDVSSNARCYHEIRQELSRKYGNAEWPGT